MWVPSIFFGCCLVLCVANDYEDDDWMDVFLDHSIVNEVRTEPPKPPTVAPLPSTQRPKPPTVAPLPSTKKYNSIKIQDKFNNTDLFPTECGREYTSRIVNGYEAGLWEYPWLALLIYKDISVSKKRTAACGGSLINKRYVVTAAHCVPMVGMAKVVGVRLGEYDLSTETDCRFRRCAQQPIDVGVEKITVHPMYVGDKKRLHDIALLRLERDITFTREVKPICIPVGSIATKSYVGEELIVAGWGETEDRKLSDVKMYVEVPVRPTSMCMDLYNIKSDLVRLSGNVICAGGESLKDSCVGDSGGPLMSIGLDAEGERRIYLVGVVASGPYPCGRQFTPAAYTRVAVFVSWMEDNMYI